MAVAMTARSQVLHLSLVLGRQLRDADGLRLGRVDDLIVRLGSDDYPPVTGALATIAGRAVFVPAELITTIAPGVVTIRKSPLDLQPFTRRPQEVLLKEDVLDRQLINVEGARLVRTNELEIARLGGGYRVVAVDTGPRGLFRRLIPRRFADTIRPGSFLDWASVEPFTGHVPTVRLRVPHPKLARLHPAELADLVEAASHREGEEILEAVRADVEREADVGQRRRGILDSELAVDDWLLDRASHIDIGDELAVRTLESWHKRFEDAEIDAVGSEVSSHRIAGKANVTNGKPRGARMTQQH